MATTNPHRYSGHARMGRYCSCGKVVYGNGGKRHFERDGHKRVTQKVWAAAVGGEPESPDKPPEPRYSVQVPGIIFGHGPTPGLALRRFWRNCERIVWDNGPNAAHAWHSLPFSRQQALRRRWAAVGGEPE